MEKKIILTFNTKTGKTMVEAFGFIGSSCEQAMDFLKDSIGKCTDFKHKEEWYRSAISQDTCNHVTNN